MFGFPGTLKTLPKVRFKQAVRSISASRDVTVLFLKNLLRSVNSRGEGLRENTENAPAARMSKEAGFTQFLIHELTPLNSSEFKFP